MHTFKQFTEHLMKHVQTQIRDEREKILEDLTEVIKNVIFYLTGPRSLHRPITRKQQLFRTIWHGYSEISKLLDEYFGILDEIIFDETGEFA